MPYWCISSKEKSNGLPDSSLSIVGSPEFESSLFFMLSSAAHTRSRCASSAQPVWISPPLVSAISRHMSGDAPSTQPSSEDESIFEEKENTVSVVFSAVSSNRLSLFCAGGSWYSPPGSICLTED